MRALHAWGKIKLKDNRIAWEKQRIRPQAGSTAPRAILRKAEVRNNQRIAARVAERIGERGISRAEGKAPSLQGRAAHVQHTDTLHAATGKRNLWVFGEAHGSNVQFRDSRKRARIGWNETIAESYRISRRHDDGKRIINPGKARAC